MSTLKVVAGGSAAAAVAENIGSLVADKVASRIAAKDFTLWGKDAEAESSIRLGWVTSAVDSQPLVDSILALRDEFRAKGVNRFVLCGMGGSSLAPEVITRTAGVELVVLDSTNADQVGAALAGDLNKTAVVVSSKSGSTVETDSQKRIFEKAFTEAGIDKTERIVIVTDPGSPMEKAAQADGYRIFNADATVGGRYSALTAFGLVPSGLAGVDIQALLNSANSVSELLSSDSAENPALILGAALGATPGEYGMRDKIGIVNDGTSIVGFGDWAEQLIAESTGKLGKGILPVVLEPNSAELHSGLADLVAVRVVADATTTRGDEVAVSGDLGAQFMLWEYATVIASRLIGINPFDQPDVESAKIAARAMLEQRDAIVAPLFVDNSIEVRADALNLDGVSSTEAAVAKLLKQLDTDSGYLSIHAYLDRTSVAEAADLRELFATKTRRPVTFGWAPRFLHSTGQYHKGGPAQGVYLQIVSEAKSDIAVPGRDFTFGELIASQAAGDAKVLADHSRAVLTLTLQDAKAGIEAIKRILA
ncbi:MAG: glucose-6-phosphate isomerase [Rhodoluna sp.]|nr:glucose-6-phosphate isomerase [Rhodoluna sp.]MBP6186597.1 glucose-6-phosphate isomerase [Rhodoluna sp.]